PGLRSASRFCHLMRTLRTLLVVKALFVIPTLTGGAMLAAQDASPYVPLQHWAMPYVEHLIATGVIADPTPLTRPFRRSDLVRALRAADTARVHAVTRRTLRQLLTALADRRPAPPAPSYRIEGAAGV